MLSPADNDFETGTPGFGARPALPQAAESVSQPGEVETPGAAAAPPVDRSVLTRAQAKKLDVLVTKLRMGGHVTTEQLWKSQDLDPDAHRDEDGELHWSTLRESLSRDQASALIDRLETLQAKVDGEAQSGFRVPASVQTQIGGGA